MATDTMLAVVKTRPERGVDITRVDVPHCRHMRCWYACGPPRCNAVALRQGLHALTQGGRVSLLGLFERPVSLDLNTEVILKDVRLYGITGRHIFATWYKEARFLQSGLLDPAPIITHRFPLGEFDQAMDLIAHGDCGKVLLLP